MNVICIVALILMTFILNNRIQKLENRITGCKNMIAVMMADGKTATSICAGY